MTHRLAPSAPRPSPRHAQSKSEQGFDSWISHLRGLRRPSPTPRTDPASKDRCPRAIDVNARTRRLSTLLAILAGATQRLELDLAPGTLRIHCHPKSLELALMEAVSELKRQLSGAGTIVIRTRKLRHGMLLLVLAREDGEAVFRFGGLRGRSPQREPTSLPACVRLARECHGVARRRGPALLSFRLPTILSLATDARTASPTSRTEVAPGGNPGVTKVEDSLAIA